MRKVSAEKLSWQICPVDMSGRYWLDYLLTDPARCGGTISLAGPYIT